MLVPALVVRPFELRLKHGLLQKPFYGTFETQEEARRVGERGEPEIDWGSVPDWNRSTAESKSVSIAKSITSFLYRSIPR